MGTYRRVLGIFIFIVTFGSIALPLGYIRLTPEYLHPTQVWALVSIALTILYTFIFYLAVLISPVYNAPLWKFLDSDRVGITLFWSITIIFLTMIAGVAVIYLLWIRSDYKYILLITLIIALLLTINDIIFSRAILESPGRSDVRPGDAAIARREFQEFLTFVDSPALVGFLLMWLFAYLSPQQALDASIEHFTHGAVTFQSLAFNTSFAIVLITE